MENNMILIRDEETLTPFLNDDPKLDIDYPYDCFTYPYPVEIFRINDEKNTVTFKCLNPKKKEAEKTILISKYLDSMKKYSNCTLCHKEQNVFKDTQIFSYCIKCGAIICPNCISKHLNVNEKNHPDLNKEYIIKIMRGVLNVYYILKKKIWLFV